MTKCSANVIFISCDIHSSSSDVKYCMQTFSRIHSRASARLPNPLFSYKLRDRSEPVMPAQWSLTRDLTPFTLLPTYKKLSSLVAEKTYIPLSSGISKVPLVNRTGGFSSRVFTKVQPSPIFACISTIITSNNFNWPLAILTRPPHRSPLLRERFRPFDSVLGSLNPLHDGRAQPHRVLNRHVLAAIHDAFDTLNRKRSA